MPETNELRFPRGCDSTLTQTTNTKKMNCFDSHIGERHALYHGDCCEVIRALPDNRIDFSIYSPPFANLYIYSDSIRDMGNCADDAEFFAQYDFLLGELLRATRPGRLTAVHCKNLVNYKGRDGRAGLRDFRGEIIRAHEKHGWQYHSEVTIWKCPVIEMQRTKAHGLLYKQLRKDSSFSRQGLPDYLVIFRKWADDENETEVVPVEHDADDFTLDMWQRYASPVWADINQTDVLNVQQARISQDEKHICPLQRGVIDRAVELWSNPGETVFTPFAGIGSELVFPLLKNRRAIGVELKREYFEVACRNIESAYIQNSQVSMFDELELAGAVS